MSLKRLLNFAPGVPVCGEPEPLEVVGRPQLVVEDTRAQGVSLAVVVNLEEQEKSISQFCICLIIQS